MSKVTKAGAATVTLAASLSMLVAGCGAVNGSTVKTAAASQPYGGTLSIGQTTKWDDEFIPTWTGSLYTQNIVGTMFDGLINVNQSLARHRGWPLTGSTPTATRPSTVFLAKNANWSDGKPIVSQDALLFMNFLASKAYNSKALQGQYGYLMADVKGASLLNSGTKTSFAQTGGFKVINSKEFQVNVTTPTTQRCCRTIWPASFRCRPHPGQHSVRPVDEHEV